MRLKELLVAQTLDPIVEVSIEEDAEEKKK